VFVNFGTRKKLVISLTTRLITPERERERERVTGIRWMGDWVDLRTGVDAVKK
jgi:hypothetical protein